MPHRFQHNFKDDTPGLEHWVPSNPVGNGKERLSGRRSLHRGWWYKHITENDGSARRSSAQSQRQSEVRCQTAPPALSQSTRKCLIHRLYVVSIYAYHKARTSRAINEDCYYVVSMNRMKQTRWATGREHSARSTRSTRSSSITRMHHLQYVVY